MKKTKKKEEEEKREREERRKREEKRTKNVGKENQKAKEKKKKKKEKWRKEEKRRRTIGNRFFFHYSIHLSIGLAVLSTHLSYYESLISLLPLLDFRFRTPREKLSS